MLADRYVASERRNTEAKDANQDEGMAKLRMTTFNKVRHPLKDYLKRTPF